MKALRLAGVILLAFLTICFASCNKDNNGNNTNDEIIEYQGEYPAPENIQYVEDGVTYEIEAIPGQVVISTDEDYNTVVNAVNAHEGKIIEQNPQFGYYLIEVASGSENDFITAMDGLSISAEYNIIEYLKEKFDYFVFDDYANVNGVQHGKKISEILSTCQSNSTIKEVNIFKTYNIPIIIPDDLTPPIHIHYYPVTLSLLTFYMGSALSSQDKALVNLSLGYGADDWEAMSPDEKRNYIKGWERCVMSKLDQIIKLKKKNPNIDIVFANAAGNERCPELSQMINDIKANPKYKKVLEENFILVSDYSSFANTSSSYGDFCYIKEHPYFASGPNGGSTSYATPQALCYINQVINGTIGEDGKNITAVQALAAVKAAIRQNSNGELDLDEALEMARIMYSPGYFTGTPFDNVVFTMGEGSHMYSTTTIRRHGDNYNPYTDTWTTFYEETNTDNSTYAFNHSGFAFTRNTLDTYDTYDWTFIDDNVIISTYFYGTTNKYKNGQLTNYILTFDHNLNSNVLFPSSLPYSDYLDNGTFVITRYFEQNNVFCIKEKFVFNKRWQYGNDTWHDTHEETERLNRFIIDERSNKCTFEVTQQTNYSTPSYGSQYTGITSSISTEHIICEGTWKRVQKE